MGHISNQTSKSRNLCATQGKITCSKHLIYNPWNARVNPVYMVAEKKSKNGHKVKTQSNAIIKTEGCQYKVIFYDMRAFRLKNIWELETVHKSSNLDQNTNIQTRADNKATSHNGVQTTVNADIPQLLKGYLPSEQHCLQSVILSYLNG